MKRKTGKGIDVERMRQNAGAAARLLKTLANEQRLRVLCALVEGEVSVGELNQQLEISQSALSQHLAKLRDEGLVTTRRESRTIHYSLSDGAAREIIGTLHGIYCEAAVRRRPRR